MNKTAISLMVIADMRHDSYTDAPPTAITPEIHDELVRCGYAVARSDHLWVKGWRLWAPRAVRAGLYRPHIPRSIYIQVASPEARVSTLDELELPAIDLIQLLAK